MLDFEADAEALVDELSNAELKEITELALKQASLEAAVEEAKAALKRAEADLAKVQEDLLPEAMKRVGLQEFKLLDGRKVTTKLETYASISKDHEAEAFAWLIENGHGPIIKNQIVAAFGTDEFARADEMAALLQEHGFAFGRSRAVHPQTLKAFVAEEMRKPEPTLPQKTFGVFQKNVAKIAFPSKRNK